MERELEAILNWYAIVEEYDSCYLTEGRDKLPDISGIARVLGDYIRGPYLAGLWQSDVVRGLAWACTEWCTQGTRASLRPARFPTPSWSWASCEKQITWESRSCGLQGRDFDIKGPCTTEMLRSLTGFDRQIWIPCLDIGHTDTQLLDTLNPYGEVKQASVTVSGKLRPMKESVLTAKDWKQRLGQASSPAACRVVRPYFDSDERQYGYSGELWSLLVGLRLVGRSGISTFHINVWSLILEKAGEGTKVFRRVGITRDTMSETSDEEACRVPEPLGGEYTTITLV